MFLVFDTETTGLPKGDNAPVSEVDNWPRVVQLAWQLHDETGKLLEHHNMVIRPEGFEIPYSAEKVHGISTAMAQEQGQSLETVLKQFNGALSQSTYLIGHNIRFDINALGAEYFRTGLQTDFRRLRRGLPCSGAAPPGSAVGRLRPPGRAAELSIRSPGW